MVLFQIIITNVRFSKNHIWIGMMKVVVKNEILTIKRIKMKKLKDFEINLLSEENLLTLKGGDSCGSQSEVYHSADCYQYITHTGDWSDEGCC